jgi:hypothetical protein
VFSPIIIFLLPRAPLGKAVGSGYALDGFVIFLDNEISDMNPVDPAPGRVVVS